MLKFLHCSEINELLRPLEDLQRTTNDRVVKLQHSLDVLAHQQRERDANNNINRDMVVLVILVVMIQAVLNWVTFLSFDQEAAALWTKLSLAVLAGWVPIPATSKLFFPLGFKLIGKSTPARFEWRKYQPQLHLGQTEGFNQLSSCSLSMGSIQLGCSFYFQ